VRLAPPEESAPTVGAALAAAIARLRAAGVPEPEADAQVLLAHALATSRAGVIASTRDPLGPAAAVRLEPLLSRRAAREPVAYVVGVREFWSLPLAVDRRVLIPRPETELLVETALRRASQARRVLDVGTGSGAVAAALARELPRATVWASDRSLGALAVARGNCARHAPAVGLLADDLLTAVRDRSIDLVVSNPPYVSEPDLAAVAPEVREFEPREALAAGVDGLAALRRLVTDGARVLVPGGWLLVEIGAGQATMVQRLFEATGCYTETVIEHDHAGIPRVVGARRRGDAEWTAS
jgi:release factor glutamine methyltransferase